MFFPFQPLGEGPDGGVSQSVVRDLETTYWVSVLVSVLV